MMLIVNDEKKAFFVCNSHVLHGLSDLAKELETMSSKDFSFHVNKNKNDFYNWVKLVLLDDKLASMLKRVKTQRTTMKKVQLRLKMLERVGAK